MVPLWGMTRWVASLFPIYLILGGISPRKAVHWVLALGSGLAELGLFAWWSSGRWVG